MHQMWYFQRLESLPTLQKVMVNPNLTFESLQLLAPVPLEGVPIYCVGLNYRSHATEAKVRNAIIFE
jgi:2-keto-4-pentenoate hydratase/2-oxohepta-3-ene-1,7-dioic acid hydratase in catechol pathway